MREAKSRMPEDQGTPVLGLTRAQLWDVVEDIAGEAVLSLDVTVRHQVRGHYGIMGEKLIPTFAYTSQSGATGECTVFVKRQNAFCPGHSEAHHYTQLARQNAPIPQLQAVLTDKCGRETLFLEYVDALTDVEPCSEFLEDSDRFPAFLATIARFNAIQPLPSYAAQIRQDMAQRAGPPGWNCGQRMASCCSDLAGIWRLAREDKLGDSLAHFCTQDRLDALSECAHRLVQPIERMATGLVHGDFYPHSTGWRRATGELVVFDLETVGFEPRFYDVAPWLGAPDAAQPRCGTRDTLAGYYLEQYARWGGQNVCVADFLEDARLLWMAWVLRNLSWWRDRAMRGPLDPTQEDGDEYRRQNRDELHRQMDVLLRELT